MIDWVGCSQIIYHMNATKERHRYRNGLMVSIGTESCDIVARSGQDGKCIKCTNGGILFKSVKNRGVAKRGAKRSLLRDG